MPDSIDAAGLQRLVRDLPDRRILVYGDLMLDEYLFGRAERLSPEKPVPVVAYERRDRYLGGAGNVVRNLQALGCTPVLVSLIGDDGTGSDCRAELSGLGLDQRGLVEEPGRVTPRKLRVHAGQHALVRIDYEDPEGAAERSLGALTEVLGALAPACDGAIVSDYRKGSVTREGVAALVAALPGQPVIADPKGGDADRYRGATALVPNERELDALLGGPWDDAGAEALRARLGLEALVVTRSERGVRVYDGGPPHDLAARARQVFDVTGAGDTFAAAFAALSAGGHPAPIAAQIANTAAGIKVRKVGTATVTRSEIEAELVRGLQPLDKRRTAAEVAAEARERRDRGETVVFTNGCFDLLHAGHIKYLEASRALGDCLIVGLNADASVRRLKGPHRPILDEGARAELLGALSCVDYVVVFEEDTPLDLIQKIKPGILTKGADYQPHEVVGADVVRAHGGRVELIDLVAGVSTTEIIGRIARNQPTDRRS